MISRLLARLTGGRPMMRGPLAFRDIATGEYVYFWNDTLGRRWLATGPWSFARVRVRVGRARGYNEGTP